ncbi:gliding motility-associated C-terminal domain-containing protein, partial [Flavobacterium collinsii]|uniref:Ig-like domain-containing protein n=1 Tax=Flavobacterium collinsii TaxID=1114861 RepID=UPI00248F6401
LTDGTVYYGSLKIGTCESPTRFAVTVTLSDPKTPTGTASQEFCKVDNKKVSDLVTTESDVTWYDAATAGNVIASTTALTNGTVYYGSLKVGTCESPTRFAVTVTLSDPKTPTGTAAQEFCKVDNKKVSDLVTTESGVTWYDAATAGNVIAPATVLENNKVYYGSLKVGTCESPTRLAVTVTLSDPKTPTGTSSQEFCKVDNKKVADLATTESDVTWYDAATAGNVIAPATVLENNKIYYGSLKVGTCESPTRFAVTVILSDPQTPTGNATQEFCKVDNNKVSDLVTIESDVTWYDAATAGNVITSTTVLENNKIYYGSLKVGTCESPTRFAVTVTLSDPQTPTGISSQEFCKVDNNKVSDLVTTESDVIWYDAATAGNVIASTTVLENNKIYYGSLKVGTCESPTRFAVTVTLSDPQTPTGTASQEFCKVDNNKVSDLVITESDVTWYDAATAGTAIASTTVLENNKVYYGSLKVGTCESPTRLAVTVTLSDPQTPTTANTTQEFCKIDNKKVSDLATTEPGVTWYDAATAGNVVPSTTALIDGTVYYGSLKIGTCESPTRLAVTVTLSDPKTPTGISSQEFCKVDNNKVSDLVTTESNVKWYDAASAGNVIASTTVLENNKVYYGSLKVGTCESPVRFAVTAIVKSNIPEPAPNWNSTTCAFDKVTYRILSGMSDYNWFVSKEGTIVAGGQPTDDYITVAWHSVGNATIKADYIDVSKCDPLVSVNFSVMVNSCSDIGLKKTINNANPFIGKEVVFTITAENFGTNMAKDITISEALPSGYVYVASEVSSGSYNSNSGMWTLPILQPKESQTLKVTVRVKERGEYLNIVYLETSNPVDSNESNNKAEASLKVKDVIVYNSVSPNGDDLNDYFRIDGLDQYPNNSVEIFNSGGIQIFKTNNYGSNNNVFRGISEGRATINKNTGVPTGSYFYILRYEMNGEKMEKSGYLYVNNLYAK